MSSIITDGWSYPWIARRLRLWNWQWISVATATTAKSGRANGHANWIASSAGARAAESATPAAWRTWCTTSGLLGILWYPTSVVQPDWWTLGRRCLAPYYWVQVCLASSTLCWCEQGSFRRPAASWHRSHLVRLLLCYAVCWTCCLLGGIPECL